MQTATEKGGLGRESYMKTVQNARATANNSGVCWKRTSSKMSTSPKQTQLQGENELLRMRNGNVYLYWYKIYDVAITNVISIKC